MKQKLARANGQRDWLVFNAGKQEPLAQHGNWSVAQSQCCTISYMQGDYDDISGHVGGCIILCLAQELLPAWPWLHTC